MSSGAERVRDMIDEGLDARHLAHMEIIRDHMDGIGEDLMQKLKIQSLEREKDQNEKFTRIDSLLQELTNVCKTQQDQINKTCEWIDIARDNVIPALNESIRQLDDVKKKQSTVDERLVAIEKSQLAQISEKKGEKKNQRWTMAIATLIIISAQVFVTYIVAPK